MGWKIAQWVIVIVALLAFLSAAVDLFQAPLYDSERRRRAREDIKYNYPIAWRYAFMVLGALYSFRFWRRGLITQFGIPNVWSWPLAVAGLLTLVALTGTALVMPHVRWWWLVLLWVTAGGGVWFFIWVVSHGGFVPMNKS